LAYWAALVIFPSRNYAKKKHAVRAKPESVLIMKAEKQIYQIKIVLEGSKPPIWRRIIVSSDTNLSKLHDIIQIVMGWEDGHLHQFRTDDGIYGTPDNDMDSVFGPKSLNEKNYKLGHLLRTVNDKMAYEYDFGDDWQHKITLEKILPFENKEKLPKCIGGKMCCPPEDCGGLWGYYDLLEAIQDEENSEHDSMLEWLGEEFDPEYFDVDEVNIVLAKYLK